MSLRDRPVTAAYLGAWKGVGRLPEARARSVFARLAGRVYRRNGRGVQQLRANYAQAGVEAELTPFIDDTASAFADADLVICRAGASTVTELAAVGAAALFVPFPHAVDDHQTTNAKFLVDAGGGWLVQQRELTPDKLATMLITLQREDLLARAVAAKKLAKTQATEQMVAACEALAQ